MLYVKGEKEEGGLFLSVDLPVHAAVCSKRGGGSGYPLRRGVHRWGIQAPASLLAPTLLLMLLLLMLLLLLLVSIRRGRGGASMTSDIVGVIEELLRRFWAAGLRGRAGTAFLFGSGGRGWSRAADTKGEGTAGEVPPSIRARCHMDPVEPRRLQGT